MAKATAKGKSKTTKVRKSPAKGSKTTRKTPAKKVETPAAAASYGDLFEPFATLRRDIDRMFESFTRSFPSMIDFDPFRHLGPTFDISRIEMAPKVEVSEDKKAYQITAELPGVEEKDVKLSLQDGMLTLSGEKKSERDEKKNGYHVSERSYGSFQRSFRLPDDVNVDKISAKFDKGVMTVTLPRSGMSKTRAKRIPIK